MSINSANHNEPLMRTESFSAAAEGIAVVGMAARFPGAGSIAQFWQNLRAGCESVTFFSEEELLKAGLSPQILGRPEYVRAKPVIDGIEEFDAAFFGISPREAELMDPQHRLFLECAWQAIEDSGHDAWSHPGRAAVFATAGKNTYMVFNLLGHADWMHSDEVFHLLLGNEKDYLSSRVSYKLNLKGPSITIQSACSSSLVAVHMACQSLLLGECDIALAGGVSVDVPRVSGYLYRPGGILSPDGHCRAFDAAAEGTTFGHGVGVVVLRKLSDALADGDFIRAVIRGTAVNNDGAERAGFTAPSVNGQAAAIMEALAVADIPAESITYVEGHGTATPVGDPIEVHALVRAFRTRNQRRHSCAIGSVKTNIGHLAAAAGIAGMIKTVLALQHREIPPSLHFERPNPHIDFSNTPFFVNTQLRPWTSDGPRRAGVSSFGQGGTNAHIVLEEAPSPPSAAQSCGRHALVISAQTASAREQAARQLAEYLDQSPFDFADVAYTLQVGRKHFNYRRVVYANSKHEAAAALRAMNSPYVFDSTCGHASPVAPRDFETDDPQQRMGELWLQGASCDWRGCYAGQKRRRVPLPTYPFQRRRHWVERRETLPTTLNEQRSAVAQPLNADSYPQVLNTLSRIFADVLGVEHIGHGDNFFDLGGHSLLEAQVRGRVTRSLGVALPKGVLFDRPTIAQLADLITTLGNEANAPTDTDSPNEIELDAAIVPRRYRGAPRFPPRKLFLTGATGFFGIHILDEVLRSTEADVYCLVRSASTTEAYARLRKTSARYRLSAENWGPRVTVVCGDLTESRFGLAESDFKALAESVDAIYHCGACVNFGQPYRLLKAVNVGGVQEALRLSAYGRAKLLHHVSSIAVFASDLNKSLMYASEDADLGVSGRFYNGYDLSKWVAEKVVATARERALTTSVYRVGNIGGHSKTGIIEPQHIISCLIKGCIQLGMAPAGDNIINVIPVDTAAAVLVRLSLCRDAAGLNFHVVNPATVRIEELVSWLANYGYRLELRSYEEWREAMRAAPDDNAFKPFLSLFDEAPLFTNRRYDDASVRKYLPNVAHDCPALNAELLHLYVSHLIRTGYLEPAASAIAGAELQYAG